jgi:uncharacterized protein YbaP (TraB family)
LEVILRLASITIAATSLLLLGASSFAADPPPVDDWTNETVIVTAQAPGPAFWRLSKGDSEIWILGTLGPMPEKLAWNTKHLAGVIDGARAVLLPAKASAGFFDVAWFLLTNRELLSMPDGQKLEASLPAQFRARFVAARESIKRKAEHYEDDAPIVAALKLENEYNDAKDLSWDEPRRTVEKIARAKHVKAHEIGNYDATPLAKELLKLGPEAARACLEDAVSDVEARTAHAVPAAEAWAIGDLKGIKTHYSSTQLVSCARKTGSYSKLDQRGIADTLAAIDEALSKPGKTVLLVDIGSLLRSTGVVEKLRAQGVVIEGPAE